MKLWVVVGTSVLWLGVFLIQQQMISQKNQTIEGQERTIAAQANTIMDQDRHRYHLSGAVDEYNLHQHILRLADVATIVDHLTAANLFVVAAATSAGDQERLSLLLREYAQHALEEIEQKRRQP